VAGWWSNSLRKKIVCPISSRIFPDGTFVHYKKELDDPSQTAEVHNQRSRGASLRPANGENEVSFKTSQSGRIMSQASGT